MKKYLLEQIDSERKIIESWQKLRHDAEFCDVTLVSGDGIKIRAHKVVLASLSDEFESMLRNENPQQQTLLYLRGVEYSQMVSLLDFIYNGKVSINQDQLDRFLSLANDLKIKGLGEEVQKSFAQNYDNFPIENGSAHEEKPEDMVKMIDSDIDPINTKFSKFYKAGEQLKDCEMYNDQQPMDPLNVVKKEFDPNDIKVKVKTENSNSSLKSCDRCSYQTKVKRHLRMHIEGIHEGVRYPCTKCTYRATTKSGVKHHMKAIHEGIKHNCPLCDFQTGNKSYLIEHTARVHDQTEYTCNKCLNTLTGKHKLDQHMKLKHKEIN